MEVDAPLTVQENRPLSTGSNSSNVLRTSLLLETMEEGEKETRIDGDGKEAVLVQTTMGEKETAIVGSKGCAMLLRTSELTQYEEEDRMEPAPTGQEAPPTTPPTPPPTLPPPQAPPSPPEPEKPEREPWPGMCYVHGASLFQIP